MCRGRHRGARKNENVGLAGPTVSAIVVKTAATEQRIHERCGPSGVRPEAEDERSALAEPTRAPPRRDSGLGTTARARAPAAGMRLVSWKPLARNSLRGFASIELPSGLRIADCPVLVSNGKAWSTLPSKPVLDREGRQVEVGGKKQFSRILEWKSRELADRFGNAIVELVLQAHPTALVEGPT
jgi:hypothetical protein